MSSLTGSDWQSDLGKADATLAAGSAGRSYEGKWTVVRDTMIAFSMQLVFRATMFLRHLNY